MDTWHAVVAQVAASAAVQYRDGLELLALGVAMGIGNPRWASFFGGEFDSRSLSSDDVPNGFDHRR